MKHTNKLALLLGLAVLAPFASAKTLEQAYIDSVQHGPGIPVPVKVVSPEVTSFDIGTSVNVEFVVDKTGHTADISIKSKTDRTFAAAVVDAIKQWEFQPAQVNGAPVATKVVLPIRVVEASHKSDAFALN